MPLAIQPANKNSIWLKVVSHLFNRNKNQVSKFNKSASAEENTPAPADCDQRRLMSIIAETPAVWKSVLAAILSGLTFGLMAVLLVILLASSLREIGFYFQPKKEIWYNFSATSPKRLKMLSAKIERQVADLQRQFDRLTPSEPYLIIDSSENLIHLKKKNQLLHQGICSTGSYTLLKTADGNEEWIFKTPRGMFHIQGKLEDPVWRMPDWAFVEEGLPVPAADADERFEYGVLGDYALSLGQGYLIHGTLYQRYLGMPVTHGCIRLGDNELKIVYRSLAIGSKVFIY